jgi:hypothetical protein
LHERSIVVGSIFGAILCLVLRMHSRLHTEIMPRRPASAHQRRWSAEGCAPWYSRARISQARRTWTGSWAPEAITEHGALG